MRHSTATSFWLRASSLLLTCVLFGSHAYAVSPLSYSGRLTLDSGKPVDGPVDLIVKFFTSDTGGGQIGSDLILSGVGLVDGVFQVELNLSQSDLTAILGNGSNATYIEVSHGGTVYPRQRFMAVPYALRVPVDGSTVTYDASGQLSVGSIASSQVSGLNAALSGKADAAHSHTIGTSGGDVSGTIASMTVNKISGKTLSIASSPTNGDVLKWNSTTQQFET